MIAFHLVMGLGQRGEFAQAGGWLARATGVLDEEDLDVVERGYLLIPEALLALGNGDPATAFGLFERVGRAGAERFGDRDLAAFGRLGSRPVARSRWARRLAGSAFLDEAMLAVTAGEVSPITVGDRVLRRDRGVPARSSTSVARRSGPPRSARWCDAQPDLVPFRGRCLVYRAELMQFHGLWRDADRRGASAPRRGCRDRRIEPAVGEAHLPAAPSSHRLRGKHAEAEAGVSRRPASGDGGRSPASRSSGSRRATARLPPRRSVARSTRPRRMARARLLEPFVEIMLAAGDVAAARAAADRARRRWPSDRAPRCCGRSRPEPRARCAWPRATRARRSRRCAARRPRWQELDAPYESARVRVLIGAGLPALGDEDAAELELDAARRVFAALGAAPDLARLDRAGRRRPPPIGRAG